MTEHPDDLDAAMQAFLDGELIEASLEEVAAAPSPAPPPVATAPETPPGPAASLELPAVSLRFRETLTEIASLALKIPLDRLDPRQNLSRYGVDSIIVTELIKRVSDVLRVPIAPTVFFEARHLEELADILSQRYEKAVARLFAGAQPARTAHTAPQKPTAASSVDCSSAPPSVSPTAEAKAESQHADARRWIEKFKTIALARPTARPVPRPEYEPIAIIAMDGRFAESADLDELEHHLRQGDDCIREVPPERWRWQDVHGDPKLGEHTNVKYGGFAPDIDKFDPLFFGMSPREAEMMDPQHRLFIQCVWRLIETAGYAPRSLAGRKIGLFIGINLQDYALLVDRAGAIEAAHLTSLGHMFCPNRLSFLLDVNGPSQVIDTACSSSLVALHRAALSIQHEGCEMAIAGGANLMISPDMHIMYSKLGMICEDGRCKTFSKHANGYARGDGVGAVLLKSLSKAERDGDTILAVIRGSAENHGGMSTSLTAPNPKAQASLIVEAHNKAGIDPRSVGYIECHGTGTPLGDPIEINGLKMAFEELHRAAGLAMPTAPFCGLGSVKSNIGHAETAAGVAGVIKTVLAIRNRQLYKTLHADELNPMIELEGSPFFVLQDGRKWERPIVDGVEQPRRAGVSSFGAGGSNAHVVIEEYCGGPEQRSLSSTGPYLILLSARTEAQLTAIASRLSRFLDTTPECDLADIAYTLQVGREALDHRLAMIVASIADLRSKLVQFVSAEQTPTESYRGQINRAKPGLRTPLAKERLSKLLEAGELHHLAELWVGGAEIDWAQAYFDAGAKDRAPCRVALPAYPFGRQRYWLPAAVPGNPDRRRRGTPSYLHPLVHRNTSNLSEQRFTTEFSGREFFLADHVVAGARVLPGVAYLEMARAAIEQASRASDRGGPVIRLRNVVWSRPYVSGDHPQPLHIGLQRGQGQDVAYRITSTEQNGEAVLHSQGTAIFGGPALETEKNIDLAALRAAITAGEPQRHCLAAAQCYAAFRAMDIDYGPGHQGLELVYYSPSQRDTNRTPQVFAKLALPAASAQGAAEFVLHPGLLDSALQACIGLLAADGQPLPSIDQAVSQPSRASLPFAIDEFELLTAPPPVLWTWIRYAEGSSPSDRVQKLDIDICDEDGRVCVRLRGFSSRAMEPVQAADTSSTLMFRPVWRTSPAEVSAAASAWARHRVLICDPDNRLPSSIERDIRARTPEALIERLSLTGDVGDSYTAAAIQLFELIKGELAGANDRALVQVLVAGEGDTALLAGLSGLVKTANRESARVFAQLIEIDHESAEQAIAGRVLADAACGEAHIRYRNGMRQVPRWSEVERPSQIVGSPWKDNGVYLITGGAGGLGLLFAKHIAASTYNATLILCGRSKLEQHQTTLIDELRKAGAKAEYQQLDVSRPSEVDAAVAAIVRKHGRIDGVLHCAGLLRDNFILKKKAREFAEVLAPKVHGTLNLDEATAPLDLDVFALFSSAAGAMGSSGQADYAAANAFLDAFANHRNARVGRGERKGGTVSIDWPLWADGGMRMEPAALAMMRSSTGMDALPTDSGLRAFEAILATAETQALVLHGQPDRLRAAVGPAKPPKIAATQPSPKQEEQQGDAQTDTSALASQIEHMLLKAVSTMMKFEVEDLEADVEWSDYGFDSISLTEFSNTLNQRYRLDLTPTIFFEHPNAAALARWLAAEHGDTLSKVLALLPSDSKPAKANESVPQREAEARKAPNARSAAHSADKGMQPHNTRSSSSAIAIVGMSGRFPMARDLDEFWANLMAGRDCISEIPLDRWDWRAIQGDPSEPGKTGIKWGGFIDGIADFDAKLFNISPREAKLMDPQQRLLMEYAWRAIEDAGYSPASLSGTATGIFVGTASSGYGELAAKNGAEIESHSSTGAVGSVGPNRMSYFLNLHGPSEPIETACSSSLVAIHRALSAMANGDCEQAIVGGINLIVSPETHIAFDKAGMLCGDGRCKSFSKHANGYVRGEGVGMLFLKRLAAAEADGDHIYGVIRGSAENHGGRGNSLTAPNPKAQAELLKTAYTRAGVDPRTIGYIEAHGTGTELGDPIEINGLKAAFQDLYKSAGVTSGEAHCGLGSVKTNIGHLELAAGIAGVIKVLLQLKHKTLVKSLHCDDVNPYIRLDHSPFYLVRESRDWATPRDSDGNAAPRRAGVSSFGFGGANAHVVIEEYVGPAREADTQADAPIRPSLIVLSAKDRERLTEYARDLLAFVEANEGPNDAADHGPLTNIVGAAVAQILGVDAGEIDPEQSLEDYGFLPVHRAILQEKVARALGRELAARAFLANHTAAAIVEALLERPQNATRKVPTFALSDLAYTLQVGRESMEERLGFVATSLEDLKQKLRTFIEGRAETAPELFVGRKTKSAAQAFAADVGQQEKVRTWLQQGDLNDLLDLWVKGPNIDWGKLYDAEGADRSKLKRISAPGYPFAYQRYWFDVCAPRNVDAAPKANRARATGSLHPLLHSNVSNLEHTRFKSQLKGDEFFLADHKVRGQRVLPGVAYLEMARAAIEHAAPGRLGPDALVELRDVAWITPAIIDQPRPIEIDLADQNGIIHFTITSAEDEKCVHSQGTISFSASAGPTRLDVHSKLAGGGFTKQNPSACYAMFAAAGLEYGPAHRAIQELHVADGEVLARLELPSAIEDTLDRYVLHPSLMDCALQASIGLSMAGAASTDVESRLALPFAVESVTVLGSCMRSMWAWVRRSCDARSIDRIQKLDIDLADDDGKLQVRIKGFSSRLVAAEKPASAKLPPAAAATSALASDEVELKNKTLAYFKELLSSVLSYDVEDIRADEMLDSYGIDSMLVTELTGVLERTFGPLPKTLFFEHLTLGDLVDHFLDAYRPQLLRVFDTDKRGAAEEGRQESLHNNPKQQESSACATSLPRNRSPIDATRSDIGPLDVAIIGLSGRYPLARDIEAYWRNLRDGRDCITEVPPERWDWRAFYGTGDQPGLHTCKWGGFIEDADKFDPLFFSISPSAAEYMDPQERLFLEHAWMAMEDAGYRRDDLHARRDDDEELTAQVGVYAGVMYSEYQLLGHDANIGRGAAATTNFYASIANRTSYCLNLHGPSMAVDTMCSSSLTAIHLACQDLKLGRTDMALAGGVNLNLHPNKYALLSVGQFISKRGKCESFGAGGEGYVPSEGVGVAVLKRLADAERDGDHIYGVIKSSALNHGGKTNGYSVPNPKAQQAVLTRALREAGIDPRAIGYIEAHGTGTRLGDPIEIAGLAKALGKHQPVQGEPVWIGSAKSNIGHGEAAAGIAGLTKVLLQMREAEIAPSLHSETLNSNIDFAATPFEVNQRLRSWPQPLLNGEAHPRVAGISSFGAGGSNAHLIVEEHVRPKAKVSAPSRTKAPEAVVVLSARSEPQLREYAERLAGFVRGHQAGRSAPLLRDVAYTLQVGREAMPYRLAFVATSLAETERKLANFLAGDATTIHVGRAKPGSAAQVSRALTLDAVAAAWVNGANVDWPSLYADQDDPPARVSLPTYPFARERYWSGAPAASIPQRGALRTSAEALEKAPELLDTSTQLLMLRPDWIERPIQLGTHAAYREHIVLSLGDVPPVPGLTMVPLHSGAEAIDEAFAGYAVQVFDGIKRILQRKPASTVLLQVIVGPGAIAPEADPLCGALAAMLKTGRMENPNLVGQLIELEREQSPHELAALLRDNGQASHDQHVRYCNGRRLVSALAEFTTEIRPARPLWREGGTYLITGGAGGLGLIFAREIVSQVRDVTLALTGRSQPSAAAQVEIDNLGSQGARIDFHALDVSDRAAVDALIRHVGPGLNGIIHSAGVIRDSFILKKTASDYGLVFAAKVRGTVNLDLATRGVNLDFFALFSSLAGAAGNPGQSDYATANAFMDAYAAYRNRLIAGEASDGVEWPKGHTVSINWPLWQDGGMRLDTQSIEAMSRTAGIKPLRTETGLAAFYRALESGLSQVVPLEGDGARMRQTFLPHQVQVEARHTSPEAASRTATPEPTIAKDQIISATGAHITKMLSGMLKLPLHRIEADVALEEYGIDSVSMMKLTADLEKDLGPLPKTVFFEHPTIDAASSYLAGAFEQQLIALFGLTPARAVAAKAPDPVLLRTEPPQPATPHAAKPVLPPNPSVAAPSGLRDVAIIGMSGRFPQAENVEKFWHNLAHGRDCITEVPADRWDHRAYFDPDKEKVGKTYCRWGGFIDGVDRFDAPFFKISPDEAELLDPQERLFLETVWNLLESSGYLGETLQRLESRVGVFVGSMSQQYHAFDDDPLREALVVMSSPSSIANRVSYFFGFQGPSLAVDTMCSASLNALHMACESLLRGECKVAIAGGINLTIHPKKYVGLSAVQLLGSHPDSTSFGDGDGYLPAEAVGAVLLKPLAHAIADGDNILAVIKSTAVNHGGQSNGYRVPSPSAQAELIAENFAKAAIDPRTVSYVESAANGSPLGDAIELNALTAAFGKYKSGRQFCAIGSVKSNIGHAEAASGMSQLIKVVLQLQHRQLAPTIKAEPLNPNIAFEQTPFYLQRQLEEWHRPVVALDGGEARELPRRASVSSFGAGGSNAHLIVEEYEGSDEQAVRPPLQTAPHLILLSAKSALQLRATAQLLLSFVEERHELALADLAYTLQTSREAMDNRLAIIANDREELLHGLRSYLDDRESARLLVGDTREQSAIKQLLSGKTGQATLAMLMDERDLEKLALYWVSGAKISWQPLYGANPPRRLALPTYPFERKRHWLGGKAMPDVAPVVASNLNPPSAVDASLSLKEIERHLMAALGEKLGITADTLRAEKSFVDYGLDSIGLTALRRGIEQLFGIVISARDALLNPTPAALARLIATHRVAAEDSQKKSNDLAALVAEKCVALSEGQKGIWLLHQMAPQMSAYNVPIALKLGARIDTGVFRRACEHVLRRFPALRSIFTQCDGELRQHVLHDAPMHFVDEQTTTTSEGEVLDLLRASSKQPFDLEHGPLFRVHVLSQASGGQSYAVITVHHIIFDGTSAVILLKALSNACEALSGDHTPEVPATEAGYTDFVLWQQQFMASPKAASQLRYWQGQLAGDLPMLALPFDRPRSVTQGFGGASHHAVVTGSLAEEIRETAKALQINVSTFLLGALKLLLNRYSGQDDILVAMPTLGRPEPRFDDVLGLFVNMIVLRSRVDGEEPTAEFLKRLQLTMADGLDNADYPFPSLLKELRVDRGRSRSPLPQVVFAFQNFVPAMGASPAHAFEVLPGFVQEGGHDLALEVYQEQDGLRLTFSYDSGLFDASTIRRMADHFTNLLQSIVSSAVAPIADLELMHPDEVRRIVIDWNASETPLPESESVIQAFRKQARATPDATALAMCDLTLSYGDLDHRSTHLSEHLASCGIAAGDTVVVAVQRGFDMVAAQLAIWKSGAVYVPIAPDCPVERRRDLIQDCEAKLVITDRATRDKLKLGLGAPVSVLAIEDLVVTPTAGSNERQPVQPDAPAYVIYTSGSTGKPKGVVVPHAAISHHCQVMRDVHGLTPQDKILHFASTAVDAALEQLLPGLLSGATIVIRPDPIWSPSEFRREVRRLGITVIDVPPSYLHEVLLDTHSTSDWDALRSVRLVITGGEALRPDTLALWGDAPMRTCRLLNAYGPTETTITSTVFEIRREAQDIPGARVPIGRPLPGEHAYVLDDHGHPVPIGVPGELHIGGAGVAIGYLHRPELTRQKFIDNPFLLGERIYKTGDLAKWREDGTIDLLGRRDHQVKVRGYRVECGEIEAALESLDTVQRAAVVFRPVKGREQLVAFVVATHDASTDECNATRRALSKRLPDYMVPNFIVSLEAMPLTPGGKVDRASLMHRDVEAPADPIRAAPRTDTERALADIWTELLDVEKVGVNDNFFDLGGHSLLAFRLAAQVHKVFGKDLPISFLFEAPDIARQARYLETGGEARSPLICLKAGGKGSPYFCVHDVSGNVLGYRELAREMIHPVYALQAPDAESGEHPGTIESLAALYIGAIRTVQAHGPYHLGGWSMGGVIAYEMARQFQQAGELIASLTLIDCYTPKAAVALQGAGHDMGAVPDASLRANIEMNVRAMNAYVPGRYRGDITLLAATEGAGSVDRKRYGDWTSFIDGQLEIVALPGDHYSVLQSPNVEALCASLSRILGSSDA